jgi:hypothetical protein
MYDHERTTFARYPYVPTRTSPDQLLSIYLGLCTEPPWFDFTDLDRHVLAIDVRRFAPEQIEDTLDGAGLSPSFWELEEELDDLLVVLIETYGDPTCWKPLLHHLPPLVTTNEPRP